MTGNLLLCTCAPPGPGGAGARRPLLLPYSTRSTRSFAPAARWRARSRSWTAAAITLLNEVYAFLRAAKWRARSRSWTAAATTLLYEVYAFLRAARWRARVIYPDFPLDFTGFFPGKLLIQFLANKMQDFRNFVLHNCILDVDAEQVFPKPQITNVKNGQPAVLPASDRTNSGTRALVEGTTEGLQRLLNPPLETLRPMIDRFLGAAVSYHQFIRLSRAVLSA